MNPMQEREMAESANAGQAAPDSDAGKTRDQQHTGNHDRPAKEKAGNEKLGGTRAGAENVEPKR
jgi:hypothetical protein